MTKIKLGGVPEYFNLPIYNAIEKKLFDSTGLDVEWQDIKEGTGAMVKYLEEGRLDMAIVLTEGAVKSIIEGANMAIVKPYVQSPLVWGVHVPAASAIQSWDDLPDKRIAISRKNSGSHLMAFLLAEQKGWEINDQNFVIVDNLDGARASFKKEESNIFLWEKYTTQPFVDNGDFRRIGEIPTPWPCFMIVANRTFAQENKSEIDQVIGVINQNVSLFQEDKDLSEIIAERFGLAKTKTDQIIKELAWASADSDNLLDIIDHVQGVLYKLGVVNSTKEASKFLS
jgi:sulfonate transport system substrate-binding protein